MSSLRLAGGLLVRCPAELLMVGNLFSACFESWCEKTHSQVLEDNGLYFVVQVCLYTLSVFLVVSK